MDEVTVKFYLDWTGAIRTADGSKAMAIRADYIPHLVRPTPDQTNNETVIGRVAIRPEPIAQGVVDDLVTSGAKTAYFKRGELMPVTYFDDCYNHAQKHIKTKNYDLQIEKG